MAIKAYDWKCIALAQLETALRLYSEGEDYFSVVTLAGASDEIFGKLLTASGRENSLESIKKAVSAIHLKLYGEPLDPRVAADRANRARNALKHINQDSPTTLALDAKEEAKDMLNRAIDNSWLLEEWLTPSMEHFQREAIKA